MDDFVNVLIPSTPNPTTGWLIVVPTSDLIEIDINVESAIRYIISGGLISGTYKELNSRLSPAKKEGGENGADQLK